MTPQKRGVIPDAEREKLRALAADWREDADTGCLTPDGVEMLLSCASDLERAISHGTARRRTAR